MITSKSYKEKLISNLRDKEYRDAFVASHIKNGIPFQIRTLRDKEEYSQDKLATLIGKQQEAISRLENPNYGNFTLKTLKEIASAFDIALIVRFVPFSELVEWDLNLNTTSLEVPSFKDESYFQEKTNEETTSGIKMLEEILKDVRLSNVIDFEERRKRREVHSIIETRYPYQQPQPKNYIKEAII